MKSKYKIFLIILSSSLIFTLYSCIGEIKAPVMPTWDSDYYLPIVSRTETLAEILKNEKNIFVDSALMLMRFDSTKTNSVSLNEMFKSDVKYDDHFLVKIGQVNWVKFKTVMYDDSVNLEEANIYYGALNYTLNNYLNKNVAAKIVIPGFTKNGTDTLKFDINANANSSASRKIDLSKYHYKKLSTSPQGIYIEGEATIGEGYSGDSLTFDVKLDSLAFNYIKAKTKPYYTKIDPKVSFIDLDKDVRDILPKVDIRGAKVYITPNVLYNNVEARIKNFQLIGIFNNGSPQKVLKINGKNVLDTLISLSQVISLGIDNFAIHDFISPQVPDSITYKGELVINPNNKVIEISMLDTISYSIKLEVFSIFKLDNADRTDTLDIAALDSTQQKNLDNVLSGDVTIEIDNPFPVDLQIVAYLTDVLYNKLIYVSRQKGDGSASDTVFTLSAAPVDAQGVVTGNAPTQTKLFKITKQEIQKIKPVRHLIFHVVASTTNKQMVSLRPNLRYSIRAWGNFNVNVDPAESNK